MGRAGSGVPEREVVLPLGRLEFFDGVVEGGARHGGGVPIQERGQPRAILLAGEAEVAADGLVDQVVPIVEQQLGEGEDIVQIALLDEVEGGDHGGAALPQHLGLCELVADVARAVLQVAAD